MRSEKRNLPDAETIVEIPFHDIDLMGVAWHGHYTKYFEIARCALLETFDYNYRAMKESGYAWPIVELKIRYAHPARLGQKIRIKAALKEYEYRLKVDYLIEDAETTTRLSRGHTIQVPVDDTTNELVFGSPAILYEKLGIPK